MNMNRSWSPPDNSNILPNMYNVLDAHALKKTSGLNGMLDYQLSTQQNVIAKHRYLAERIHREERARVTNALTQIQDRLPAVERIRDFNMKFFGNKSLDPISTHKKTKSHNGYNKSDEPICRRCYNHHFAIQRHRLTNGFALPSIPRNRRFPPTNNLKSTQQQKDSSERETENPNQVDQNSTDNNNNDQFLTESETLPNFLSSDKVADVDETHARSRDLASPTKQAFGWWMPCNKTYKFLQKDRSGREIDVNKHYSPRLMPYEDWKNVVRDVCAHCARPGDCVASRQPRGSIDVTALNIR